MECRVAPLRDFLRADLDVCGTTLCRNGSEMQSEFLDAASDTPLSIVYDGIHPVAWTATHQWNGFQTLEGFTRETFRLRGLCRFAAGGLIAAGHLKVRLPVAVFSPLCACLTLSLGFARTRLFQRDAGGEWIEAPL